MILNASGCLDALVAPDVARSLDAFVTKTVTPLPREGNPPIRIAETDCGMVNSIGLANSGIERFCVDTLPRLRELGVPLWVSVGGFSAPEYADMCVCLDAEDGIDVLELNVSCPNDESPVDAAEEIVLAARSVTAKTLYTKLSPQLPDVAAAAERVAAAGTDGLSLVNTLYGMALDERTLQPVVATGRGGLSGPGLRPVALAAVHACARATGLPIVGMGGVETGRHALELMAAGAHSVALGTVLFRDPDAPARVRAELAQAAAAHGFATPADAVGAAHEPLPVLAKKPAKSQ